MGKIYDAIEKTQQLASNKVANSGRTNLSSVENTMIEASTPQFSTILSSVSARLDSSLVSYFKPQSIEAEQFRKLAANVLFRYPNDSSRCLLVTSANQGEGKSFLTANLAISLAKSLEEPVLLVDCDLRRPQLHKLFGFGNVSGLSDHFSKEMDISALIQQTLIQNLTLLPAGNKSFHSAELLSSKRMSNLLKILKKANKDRIILIDSPPPLSTAEPTAIARQMDDVILVVKCEETQRSMVEDLIKNIGKEKILGVVLNRFNKRFQKYYKHDIYQ